MSIERNIYKKSFEKNDPPQWLCPDCNKGILKIQSDTFIYKETKESLNDHKLDCWEPEFIEYVFSCQLSCTNPTCYSTVACIGTGKLNYDEFEQIGIAYFYPKYFIPALNIFKIPQNTPKDVKISIKESFQLFFASPSASANHLRISLEKILDCLKIKKFNIKNGKKIRLSLHQRIESIPVKLLNLRNLLLAVKWLGNTGSHPNQITTDEVLDAYDIFEVILEELFEKRLENITRLANKINTKKGINYNYTKPPF